MNITARNEFEPIQAFTTVAGSTLGTWTTRETTHEMINILDMVQHHVDTKPLYKELAQFDDDDTDLMFELQEDIAEHLNYYAPLPDYCSITLQDNEWIVLPDLEAAQLECKTYSDYPDGNEGGENTILVVNDHGNVTCQQWSAYDMDYVTIWDMV